VKAVAAIILMTRRPFSTAVQIVAAVFMKKPLTSEGTGTAVQGADQMTPLTMMFMTKPLTPEGTETALHNDQITPLADVAVLAANQTTLPADM